MENSYLVKTRIVRTKLPNHRLIQNPCRIPCSGSFWNHPCYKDDYQDCDACVCYHCVRCQCESPELDQVTFDD